MRLVRGFGVLFAVSFILLLLVRSASFAGTAEGVDWLDTQLQPDNSYSNPDNISTPYQSTAEALRAFHVLGSIDVPGLPNARQFIENEQFQNTEYLVRKIIARADAGGSTDLLITDLLDRQNLNGGWGDFLTYDSTALDTAYALEALGYTGFLGDEIGSTLFYLSSEQNPDGGWSDGVNDSSVFTTAQMLAALSHYQGFYQLDAMISAARDFLLTQQLSNNLWDETFQSALALIGLISTTDDFSGLTGNLSALRVAQLADGSWEGQAYATALALRALKLSEATPTNPGLASINGTLIDGQTGLPLAGVSVDLSGPASQQVTTGSDGVFIIQDLIGGSYTLVFSLSNYNSVTATTSVSAQQNVNFGTILLVQGATPTAGTVRGTVTDSSTGQGLADVTITVSSVASPVQTDANGDFQVSNVPPGLLSIQADKSGYSSASGSVNMAAGDLLIFSPILSPVVMPITAIQGTVTDGSTGQPLAGVTVSVTGSTTASILTDAQGAYQLAGLVPGVITVEAILTSYDSAIAITSIAENSIINFSPELYPDNTTPPGSNTAGMRGVVLNSTTNQPLAGVDVVATFGAVTQSQTTGVDGIFELSGFTDTAGAAQFSLADFTGVTIAMNLTPLEILDIGQVRLRPQGVAQLLPDMVVESITLPGAITDPLSLILNGSADVTVVNQGTASTSVPVEILAFYDTNGNDLYDPGTDIWLGSGSLPTSLAVGESQLISISVNGQLPFRDAPIHVWVDSSESVAESSEHNNVTGSSSACTLEPLPSGQLELGLKWQWSGTSAFPNIDSVHGPVGVAQLSDDNGDGIINTQDIPDLVFTAGDSTGTSSTTLVVALSGDDGHELWSINNTSSSHRSSVALGDIDGDGLVEIIIPGKGRGALRAFENDGTLKWDVPTGPVYTSSFAADGVAIADIDHDGSPEILHNRHVFNADGSLRWEGAGDYGGYVFAHHWGHISIAADVDLDGPMEVIAGRTLYDVNGNIIWHRSDISSDGWNAVGNFDTDDFAEIVLVSDSRVYLLEHTGETIWGPVLIPGGGYGGAPTVADFDGDGEPEIGVAGANNYVVFETDGSVKWTSPTSDLSSSATGSSVFDFEGDGKAEVLYADEVNFYIYDGETGSVLSSIHNTSITTIESPTIADVDNDGQADIILGSTEYGNDTTQGVRVFESLSGAWAPTRSIWNQHSYHINNVNDDGTIPVVEQASWLSHNSYRLNTFADHNALSTSDLTAGALQIIENSTSQLLDISVIIGNAGSIATPSAVTVAFYEGDPENGGTLLGSLALDSLAPGSFLGVQLSGVPGLTGGEQIFALVDPANLVAECDETNNLVSIAVPPSSRAEISVSTDLPVYAPSAAVLLLANMTNISTLSGVFSAMLQVEDAAGVTVASFASQDLGALAGGEEGAISDGWNTASFLAGPYVLRGMVYGADGAVLDESVAYFSIEHPDADGAAVLLRTTTDKPVYHTTATVQIQDVIQNLTQSTLIDDALLRLIVMDPSGATIHTQDIPLGQLLPSTVRDLTDPLVLQDAPSGSYTILGAVIDNQTGNLLASDQASFQVQPDLGLVISGTVVATYTMREAGEPQTCTDNVTNNGSVSLGDLPVRQVFARIDEAVEVGSIETSLTLTAGETSQLERNVETTGLVAGDYACILQASIDGEWTTLDAAIFTVTVPPINIEAALATGDRGRVLVLVDTATNGGGAEDCSGVQTMELGLTFNPMLAPDATASVALFDAAGSQVDTELVDLATLNGGVNANSGTGGVDLNVIAFTADNALLSLDGTATPTGIMGDGYQVVTTITEGTTVRTVDSTVIPTSCEEPVFISDIYGGYQIRTLSLDDAGNDPHGNADIPAPWYQQAFLEQLLDEAGWTYTITTNGADFASELRTGGYTTYLLLSEQEQLAVNVEEELREAVFRGEGLVVAGGHDERNGKIEAALGVKVVGKHSNTTGLGLNASALHTGFNTGFVFGEHTLRLQLEGATAIGPFNFEAGSNIPADVTAVATQDYGTGKSVIAGFDLLAEATGTGADSEYAELLLNALTYVHPTSLIPYPTAAMPLELALTNLGVATPGEVTLTLPVGVTVIDSGAATVQAGNTLNWMFDLAETEVSTLTLWLRLPEMATLLTVTADVATGIAPDLLAHTTASLEIVMQASSTLNGALSQLAPIANDNSRDNGYDKAETSLERAQTWLGSNKFAKALQELLKATNDLKDIDEPEAASIRLQVDQVIRDVERQL